MKAGGKPVLQVQVVENELKVDWVSEDWDQWKELHASPEFRALRLAAKEKLDSIRSQGSKGAGKGPLQ